MAADFVLKASLEKVKFSWTKQTGKTSHYLGNRVPAVNNSKPQNSILMHREEIVGCN